jgi:hypothetical protein
MNTTDLIEIISKCLWIGDKNIMNSNIYLNRKAVLDALFNGTFYTDCTNFVNLVDYLTTDPEYMPFQLRCGVYSIENARYCGSKSHLLVTNNCNFSAKGQWIIEIDGSWYGMTELGVTSKTLEEWLEFAYKEFINAGKKLNLSKDLVSDPWVAHTCMEVNNILLQEPTLEQQCMIMQIKVSKFLPRGHMLSDIEIPNDPLPYLEIKPQHLLTALLKPTQLKPTQWKHIKKDDRISFPDGRRILQRKRF